MATKVDHWVTSPYCFCKELPWLVLSGMQAAPVLAGGGWRWEDWAILAAALIALALLLFLLFLLCCLLCPRGVCCGGRKEEKKKMGAGQAVEMSTYGDSDGSTLTAVDLKLPRAWMDGSKGDLTDDRGDLGLGLGTFGNHKMWNSHNGDASGKLVNRSATFGDHRGRSALEQHSANSRYIDGEYRKGSADDSARLDYYRNQSAATLMTPKVDGNLREAVQEWQRKSTSATRRLTELRQTRKREEEEGGRDNRGFDGTELSSSQKLVQQQHSKVADGAYSSVHDRAGQDCSTAESGSRSSNLALVKAGTSSSGSSVPMTASSGEGTPIVQCYTVTKKVTTTTYGDEEGDEETSVVTTTEKKWREGMSEVGEITMSAEASAGELLPSIGAPPAVLSDTNNVRTVKSLTQVEGGVSDIERRYEFQQSRDTTLSHVGSSDVTSRSTSYTVL